MESSIVRDRSRRKRKRVDYSAMHYGTLDNPMDVDNQEIESIQEGEAYVPDVKLEPN